MMKSILHPSFRYTPSVETDIRKTFARVRREQKKDADREAADKAEANAKSIALATVRKVR